MYIIFSVYKYMCIVFFPWSLLINLYCYLLSLMYLPLQTSHVRLYTDPLFGILKDTSQCWSKTHILTLSFRVTRVQVAQWLAYRIDLLTMKIVGGSNPTVSSLVGPERVEVVLARRGVPGGCLRLLRSDRPNTAAHGTAPQKPSYESDQVDPRGTSIRKYTISL
jgi:hypothetical protein